MTPGPGVLPPRPAPRPLPSISPSRYIALRSCPLNAVWTANGARRPLPDSPAARVGTVAHTLLEEAGRGSLEPDAVERRWSELVEAAEDALGQNWLARHLVPLTGSVPDFEVRRLQAIRRATELAASARERSSIDRGAAQAVGQEVPVVTPDGLVTGRIDAVVPTPDGLVIRDYKSGAIFDPESGATPKVKEAYAIQLKLYAAMYEAMTGSWPSRLEILPLTGPPEGIAFDPSECVRLLEDAASVLHETNRSVEAGLAEGDVAEVLARPSAINCRFCPFRPWCEPYQRTPKAGDGWPNDCWGEVRETRRLGNGRVMLTLESEASSVLVGGLDSDPRRHPALPLLEAGLAAAAYNLRRPRGGRAYTEGPMTVLYVTEQAAAVSR